LPLFLNLMVSKYEIKIKKLYDNCQKK